MSDENERALEGLTREQVEARLGKPAGTAQTDKQRCWIYYYGGIEVYFDKSDVVEWVYDLDAKERVL